MRDIENDGNDENDVIHTLRHVVPDVALDDLQFERLVKRVNVAGTQRLRGLRMARRRARIQWTGSFVSAGLAASAIFALIFMHATPASSADGPTNSLNPLVVTETVNQSGENRRELFAASMGEISEDEFLSNVWGHVDAETLLSGERE